MMVARIGFIGLGNMGGGMAANLARAGHAVRAFDLSPDALDKAEAAGCLPADSAAAACDGAEAIVTMLPAGRHVEGVLTSGVFGAAPPSAILIDCSTIDIATSKRLADTAHGKGFAFVDAPVSGGIGAANAGTLTFMVGGPDAAFERARPVLAAMGKAVIHAGANGAGLAAKICNNVLLGSSMIATCEALALTGKLGLDPQTFYDIASVSTGSCWSLNTYAPLPGVGPQSPADNGYRGGFAAALMLKDLRLALEAATEVEADLPMGERATELYQRLVDAGEGDHDFSGIIRSLGVR